MSWLPILLIAWVAIDVVLVATVAYVTRRSAHELGAPPATLAAAVREPAVRRTTRGAR